MKKKADRRRAAIISRLFEGGGIDVTTLLSDDQFKRSFDKPSAQTLYGDMSDIEGMLNNDAWGIVDKQPGSLRVKLADYRAWERRGFTVGFEPGSRTDELNRIAKCVVGELLSYPDVVYLGAGTTVFQVAVELLKCSERRAEKVVTDNLAVVELFRNRERLIRGSSDPPELVVLGGVAKFDKAHISLDDNLLQLQGIRVTKTIMSCTSFVPRTGVITSNTLALQKGMVLQGMTDGALIIPAEGGKKDQGGNKLTLPDAGVTRHIVTSGLFGTEEEQLRGHGFQVHTVD